MGGGGFSMEPDNLLLDAYALALTGKEKPKVCFIPTASFDSQQYVYRFHKHMKKFTRKTTALTLMEASAKDARAVLLEQDLIYVGGGNTMNMLKVWRAQGVDEVLREAYERGIVLAGISAGSICWFEQALTDSLSDNLDPMSCLGFLPGSNCVHYDGEANRRPRFHEEVGAGRMAPGLACDDGVAAHFIDEALHAVVSSRPESRAWRVGLDPAGRPVEAEIVPEYLGGKTRLKAARTVIRRAAASDIPGIRTAHHASVRDIAAQDYSGEQVSAWTARILDRETVSHIAYQIKQETVWVVERDGIIEGFAHFRTPADIHPAGYLHALYLTPEVAGAGVGRRMLQLVEEHARKLGYTRIGLHSSRTARGFYLKLGYFDVGTELLHLVQGVGLPSQPMAKDLSANVAD